MKFISTSLSLIYIGSLYVTKAEKGNMRGLHSSRDLLEQTTSEPDVFAEEQVGILAKETKHLTKSHGSTSGSGSSKSGKSRSRSRSRRDLGTVSEFDIVGKGATPVIETPIVVFEKKSYSGPSKGKGSSSRSHYGYGSSPSKGKGSSRSHSSYGGGYYGKVVEEVGKGSY